MKFKQLFIVVATLFVLTSCNNSTQKGGQQSTSDTLAITQRVGNVVVPLNPKRVVALDYSSLENLDYLQIPVVGIVGSHLPTYLAKYGEDKNVQDVGTLFEVDYEKLNDLNPDIIFISARMEKLFPELSKIAPTVYLDVEESNATESFIKNFTLLGKIFQKEDVVKAAVDGINTEIAQLKERATNSNSTGLIILHNNGKLSAFGPGSRFGIIHDQFAVKPAVADLQVARHGQPVSSEFIKKANPDYLFLVDRSSVVNKQSQDNSTAIDNPLIRETTAFKNGRVVVLDPEAWYISGDGIISFKKIISDISSQIK